MNDENIFVDAAACGDMNGIRELLADSTITSSQVNRIDKDGRSAFHYACLNDDVPLLKILLADPRVDVYLRTPKGDSCMHLAALYACLEVLQILFKHPATTSLLKAQNSYGETPLHLCAGSGDKGAVRAAQLLLTQDNQHEGLLLVLDKWERTPLSVAHDNGENSLVAVFDAFLLTQSEETQKQVHRLHAHYVQEVKNNKPVIAQEEKTTQAKNIFAALSVKPQLKKVVVHEKTMFAKSEGTAITSTTMAQLNGRKVLSKLIDFPGDVEEITRLIANEPNLDLGGQDAYGLTALQKFASWNKTELMDLLLPHLSKEEINFQDREGKTALHWAVEMAAVASVSRLVREVDPLLKDSKGRTAKMILDSAGDSNVIVRLRNALQG